MSERITFRVTEAMGCPLQTYIRAFHGDQIQKHGLDHIYSIQGRVAHSTIFNLIRGLNSNESRELALNEVINSISNPNSFLDPDGARGNRLKTQLSIISTEAEMAWFRYLKESNLDSGLFKSAVIEPELKAPFQTSCWEVDVVAHPDIYLPETRHLIDLKFSDTWPRFIKHQSQVAVYANIMNSNAMTVEKGTLVYLKAYKNMGHDVDISIQGRPFQNFKYELNKRVGIRLGQIDESSIIPSVGMECVMCDYRGICSGY